MVPNLYMQLDHSAGNIVIEATCSSSGPSYQEWLPIAGPNGSDYYESQWEVSSQKLVLTYNENASTLSLPPEY